MKQFKLSTVLFLICTCLAPALDAGADSIKNSPHDLSSGSSASIRATTESRICVFCHIPHAGKNKTVYDPTYTGPLWSRSENLAEYQPYVSDTIAALPGQPLGASRLCLSCHDGTIALGAPRAHKVTEVVDRTLSSRNIIGGDLKDDHPVSMEYYQKPEEFNDPGTISLLKPRGIAYVECTSCHDPHNNQYGKFLVMDTSVQKDALCTVCHNKSGWSESTHKTGGTRYTGTVPQEVAQSGCISCHTPHGAQRGLALLKLPAGGESIDTNCYNNCHNGVSPYSNFQPAGGMNTHTLAPGVADLHKHTESLPLAASDKHVHCIDCHNPHMANFEGSPLGSATPQVAPASQAPNINGPLKGVRGVSISGQEIPAPEVASYEYEICFRCHAGAQASGIISNPDRTQRIFDSLNESERFNPATATSYHPVAGSWTGGASLRSDLPKPDHIYCSNCHNPHGSDKPHLLLLDNLDTFSQTQSTDYPLCYSCHSETWLMDTVTDLGKLHKAHVFGLHDPSSANPNKNHRASCSVCHDPHGVPLVFGSTADNSSRLINFDRRYAPVDSVYSESSRSCSITGPGADGLNCHAGAGPYSYNPYPYSP